MMMKGMIEVKIIKVNNTNHAEHNGYVVAVRWNSRSYAKRNFVGAKTLSYRNLRLRALS